MLLIIMLVVLLLMGMPIYVALGLTTMIFMIQGGMDPALVAKAMYAGADQYPLIAVTGFILVGNLFEKAGITSEVINLAHSFMGRSKLGLAIITIASCAIFAAVSGSGPATVATIGGLMIPAMIKAGYPASFAGGVSAAGGGLGVLIPPSNPFLMYGIIARESIAALFISGLIPGLVLAVALSFTSSILTKRHAKNMNEQDDGPPAGSAKRKKGAIYAFGAFYNSKWAILAIFTLLGGIYLGFFTPIEAAEVTVFYTIVIGLFVTRAMTVRDIWEALVKTMSMSGTLLILVAIATAFGRLITMYQIPDAMGKALSEVTSNPEAMLLIIVAILIFVGTWAETFSMIVVLTPVFLPIVVNLGVDPIHFGVIFVVSCVIGFLTPPFGCNLFVAVQLTGLRLEVIFKAVLPFLLTYIAVLVLLIYFPSLSTFLPRLIYG
ncbi:MAG: TRAP transporter large permease [Planctomycetota bacterium]|jgi:C4-dicarboxylate transporter DctM subunit|nr:TRAP transporter large permease [Planctomycetota bacterium]